MERALKPSIVFNCRSVRIHRHLAPASAWRRWLCLAPLWLALLAGPAQATRTPPGADIIDMSLEDLLRIEVVTAASGVPQKLSEAPSSVTILSGADIRALGYRTLADALAGVRGIYVTSDRIYQYVGGRGFSRLGDFNGVFLVLVNGHPINDHVYGFAGTSTDGIVDLDDIDRIEVARGPISSIYGTAAYLGVVNVITRTPGEKPRLEARVDVGSFGTRTGHLAWYGHPRPDVGLALGGSYRDSDGPDLYFPEFDTPETGGGRARGLNGDKAGIGFVDATWRDFRLEARGQWRDKDIPTGIYETAFGDPRTMTRDASGYVDLRYDHLGAAADRFVGRLALSGSDYTGEYAYARPDSTGNYVQSDFGRGNWLTANAQYARTAHRHNLLFGAEFVRNLSLHQATWDEYGSYIDDRHRSTSGGLFAQDDFPLAARLRAHAALRWDRYSFFGGIVNPRVALVWSPADRNTLKALYGSGFRAPNAYEIYYALEGYKPAHDLEPEKVRMLEFVWDREFSSVLSGMVLAFGYDARDLIVTVTDPADSLGVFRNVDRARSRGVELELRGRWPNGVHGNLSYTWQEGEDPRTGGVPANSPAHLGRAALVWPLLGGRLQAGADLNAISRRFDRAGGRVAGYMVVNGSLTAPRLLPHAELSLSAYNLFDARYADPVDDTNPLRTVRQDGRTWQLRLRLGS